MLQKHSSQESFVLMLKSAVLYLINNSLVYFVHKHSLAAKSIRVLFLNDSKFLNESSESAIQQPIHKENSDLLRLEMIQKF